jgi:pyruvate dehydrogenase E1 component
MQAEHGGSVYVRLSTRPLEQPSRRMTDELRAGILAGAYWLVPPGPRAELAIVACGPVVAEAIEARRQLEDDLPGTGLLIVTSPDRLQQDWRDSLSASQAPRPHIDRLLAELPAAASLITLVDAHPATLSWMAGVRRHRIMPLGVDRFGQSGDIPDLYRAYGIDAEAIVGAAARLLF